MKFDKLINSILNEKEILKEFKEFSSATKKHVKGLKWVLDKDTDYGYHSTGYDEDYKRWPKTFGRAYRSSQDKDELVIIFDLHSDDNWYVLYENGNDDFFQQTFSSMDKAKKFLKDTFGIKVK